MQILDFLRGRKGAYQRIPEEVLRDLAVFCRANENAAVPGDDHKTWMLIGRREVWLRIQQHINLSPADLAALFTGKSINPGGDNA